MRMVLVTQKEDDGQPGCPGRRVMLLRRPVEVVRERVKGRLQERAVEINDERLNSILPFHKAKDVVVYIYSTSVFSSGNAFGSVSHEYTH